ncbi:hypothetical protein MOSE0_D05270 [Monosporozyma servazzii]
MLSHVVEFSCQYSDQVRKKQKVWHDGKLKYFQINNKFMLYTEDNVMLSSSFVTNPKEITAYLDEEGFEITEHKIFGSFMVVINEIIAEYDREIQHIKTTTATSFNKFKISSSSVDNNVSTSYIQHPDKMVLKKTTENISNSKNISSTNVNKSLSDMSRLNQMSPAIKSERYSAMVGSGLALKVNKPFKPPRMANKFSTVNKRPNIRNAQVKQESMVPVPISSNANANNFSNINKHFVSETPPLSEPKQDAIHKKEPTLKKEPIQQNNNINMAPSDNVTFHDVSIGNIKRQNSKTFKIRVITHKPIVLP